MPCGDKGERNCTDWQDWREHCYDPKRTYKKKWKCNNCDAVHAPYLWDVTVEETSFCVEYDIHPHCQDTDKGCDSEVCLKHNKSQIEFGLPFWQGKCDPVRNQQRAEKIAVAMLGDNVSGSHLLVDVNLQKDNPTCAVNNP